MKLLCALLLSSPIAGSQTVAPASQILPQTCDKVRPAALAYFQARSMPLAPSPQCEACLEGSARHLHDAAGHRLFSNRKVIEENTTKDLRYERIGPVQQIVHWDMRTDATLKLEPAGETCKASLVFKYSWYGAALVLGFPVDGDPSSAPSNGRLERAYLAALEKQVEHQAVARR